jgi:GR25 family glycosyltransferase involved in LPS biosynthesis
MNLSYSVISLSNRKDRLDRFLQQAPQEIKEQINIFCAIDGNAYNLPKYWTQGHGAFGCYQSHMKIIKEHIDKNNNKDLCIFEDDAIFCGYFFKKMQYYFSNLPSDWEQFFLGGQYHRSQPIKFSKLFYTDASVLRTHAYIIKKEACNKIYHLLLNYFNSVEDHNHIDHVYAKLHKDKVIKAYCPDKWLCGQIRGYSDISKENYQQDRWWNRQNKKGINNPGNDIVIVLGLHGSGTSCVATILNKLKVFMGDRVQGHFTYMGGGGEDAKLAKICENIFPTPTTTSKLSDEEIFKKLAAWIVNHRIKGKQKNILVGCKYPTLCAMGKFLTEIVDPINIKIIHCDRDIEESINSLVKRGFDKQQAIILQNWLWANKLNFLYSIPHDNILHVQYKKLINQPAIYVDNIIKFLNINPSDNDRIEAIKHIKVS